MTWVLIIGLYWVGMTTIGPFNSQKECEDAGQAARTALHSKDASDSIGCVPGPPIWAHK